MGKGKSSLGSRDTGEIYMFPVNHCRCPACNYILSNSLMLKLKTDVSFLFLYRNMKMLKMLLLLQKLHTRKRREKISREKTNLSQCH